MIYGRILSSFFDSSINDAEPETRLVFIGMIVLSDRYGRIDKTVSALARQLNLSTETVERAIATLSKPDESSRTLDYEGRRIIPIDRSRSWGWIVVNKEAYRRSDRDPEEERAAARERKRRQRTRIKDSSLGDDSGSTRKESKNSLGVTVTQSHARVTARHAVSREKRDAAFDRVWSQVPRKEGKQEARNHFEKLVRAATDEASDPEAAFITLIGQIERGVSNYTARMRKDGTDPKFYMQGRRLIHNFRDYVGGDWIATQGEPTSRDRQPGDETARLMRGDL